MSRRSARTLSTLPAYRESTVSDEDPLAISPAAGSKRKRAVASLPESDEESFTGGGSESELTALEEEEEGDEYGFGELDPPSVKKKKNALRKGKVDAEDSPTKKTPTKRARKMAQDAATAATEGDSPVKTPRKRQARAPKPEPVYVIPDVEKLETTFKGRLGFACLNTILRAKKPADQAVFCSRTCRIDSIKKNGIEWVKELGRQNMKDLVQLIEWNEANNIRFMRMSSEMFPFASHPEYGYSLEYCAEELKAAGDLAKKYGHRLTTHPGQFTQLGSPREEVVKNAVRDLTYHAEMIDRMGLGKDSVMIIHGGGVYGDKESALERFKKNYTELLSDSVKNRLVLENDEMCYSAADLLPVCEELNIPLVFDYHHDWILPSLPRSEIITRANAIFARKGIKPKQHLSEPRPGAETVMERRAHADRCQRLPDELPDDMDLMIEAKDKEQAVLHLYRIYGLQPVNHASLRPPADKESKETKGKKSNKAKAARDATAAAAARKKAAQTGVVLEEEEIKGEDPAVPVDGADPDDESVETRSRRIVKVERESEEASSPPKAKRGRKKVKVEAEDGMNVQEVAVAPKKTPAKRGKKTKSEEQDYKLAIDEDVKPPVKKRKARGKTAKEEELVPSV